MKNSKITSQRKKELLEKVSPIVEEFRGKYLNSEPIEDTIETLEQLGFLIVKFPAPDKLSGFHVNKTGFDCIFVNSSHTLGRQNFSAWHEVYHAYTGDIGGISYLGESEYNEMEQKADLFASNILMPAELIEKYIDTLSISEIKYISNLQLIKMQNYFKVSYSAIITRLCFLYPEYAELLNKRRGLGSLKRSDEMKRIVKSAGMTLNLTVPSNEFYITPSFYKSIYENLEKDRITADKAHSILEMLEGVKNRYPKRH